MSWNVHASEYVPEVYQDDYIVVRSGIEEAGRIPVHFGDRLSLVIEAELKTGEVIVEKLDEQLFERSWGSEKGIQLIGPPDISRMDAGGGRSVVRSTYHFQVLDCPDDLNTCRGNKVYPLPIFTLGYQLIDDSGNVVNNRSVRFTPEPESLVVMQSLDINLEGGLDKFTNYLGNSGYPAALEMSGDHTAGMWPLMTGGLVFLASFVPLLFSRQAPRRVDDNRRLRHRWEKALAYAEDNSNELGDEEWSDLLRRSLTWYCRDELGINPYTWMDRVHGHAESPVVAELREYFIEVLNRDAIETDQRPGFIEKYRQLVEQSV